MPHFHVCISFCAFKLLCPPTLVLPMVWVVERSTLGKNMPPSKISVSKGPFSIDYTTIWCHWPCKYDIILLGIDSSTQIMIQINLGCWTCHDCFVMFIDMSKFLSIGFGFFFPIGHFGLWGLRCKISFM